MISESNLIQEATFNPRIKDYILWVVALFFVISIVGIPLCIVWFLGVGQSVSKKYYESLSCELTDRHLEFKKGILFKIEKTIPLENIQDLTFIENPFLKWFDLRILKIETAGQGNPHTGGSDMKLVGILDSADFKTSVLNQRGLLGAFTSPVKKTNQANSDQTENLLVEIREILKRIENKS